MSNSPTEIPSTAPVEVEFNLPTSIPTTEIEFILPTSMPTEEEIYFDANTLIFVAILFISGLFIWFFLIVSCQMCCSGECCSSDKTEKYNENKITPEEEFYDGDVRFGKPVLLVGPELEEFLRDCESACESSTSDARKFVTRQLKMGGRDDSMKDIFTIMNIVGDEKREIEHKIILDGYEGIVKEWETYGDQTDLDNLRAIQHGTNVKFGHNQQGEPVILPGRSIKDILFHTNEIKRLADDTSISHIHILALRMYTSKSFWRINQPLRSGERTNFIATTYWIIKGIKELRRVYTDDNGVSKPPAVLWRGLKKTVLTRDFINKGGTEMAPMSTTESFQIAAEYALADVEYTESEYPVLLRLCIDDPRDIGADLNFLSVKPEEKEYLYPPMTYLKSKPGSLRRHKREVVVKGENGIQKICREFVIIDVYPKIT